MHVYMLGGQYITKNAICRRWLSYSTWHRVVWCKGTYISKDSGAVVIIIKPSMWHDGDEGNRLLYNVGTRRRIPKDTILHSHSSENTISHYPLRVWEHSADQHINPLNPELNPICYLLALLGAHHFLHVSRIRVKLLTFRLIMSYIYGAPILDVSRSHTTTQHSL